MLSRAMLELAAAGVLLLEISACGSTQIRTGSSSRAAATAGMIPLPFVITAAPKRPDTVQAFMKDHFVFSTSARDEVIVGDLQALREPLQLLADYRSDAPALEDWKPWLGRLQSAARMTAQAGTIELAATGVATMARICGECHREKGGGPTAPRAYASGPPMRGSLAARMHAHAWASDRLWEGLTTPSDAAWRAGAAALAQSPAGPDDGRHPAYAAEFARIRSLGASAVSLTESEERADVYGVLLTVCGHCHVKSGVSIKER